MIVDRQDIEAEEVEKWERKQDPRQCRSCEKVNTLDQWYELPNTPYLVCSICAATETRARPVHINTIADRLVSALEALQKLKVQYDELKAEAGDAPGLEKQFRRLARAVERQVKATEQIGKGVNELVENLSPRWLFHVEPDQKEFYKTLMLRLSEDAGPGALLEVTQEEWEVLQHMVKL